MGTCIYCGEEAGWFRKHHAECEARAKAGFNEIATLMDRSSSKGFSEDAIFARVDEIKATSRLTDDLYRSAVEALLTSISRHILEDDLVTAEEEVKLSKLIEKWRGVAGSAAINRVKSNIVKSITLSELAEGRLPNRFDATGLGIIFRQGEIPLWAFGGSKYYVYKKNRQFIAGSRGVSVRVAKGVYFRAGASRGRSIVTEDLTLEDQGVFVITSKAIHFKGGVQSFRMELGKIQSVQPFSDSVEISDTRRTSKPFFFSMDDPVFAANILMAAMALSH